MSYYADFKDEAIDTFTEHIESLEDALDDMQDERDEYLRLLTECFHKWHEVDPMGANVMWWEEPTLQAELPPHCFKESPGECISETALTSDGNKPKSYCKAWERWTNCREVGHCVKAAANE